MAHQVAFLRGINLGSTRRIAMSELRDALAAAGHRDVRTHLQSGNVVLESSASAAELAKALEEQIAEAFGVTVEVVIRTRAQLAAVVQRDPLGDVADNPSRYLVTFLTKKPAACVLRELVGLDAAPERLVAAGREIYSWHPDGIHGSRLARELTDRRLGVVATSRNWNTVTKLLELAAG
jgi:uncharacterized protein (DUF1697 family)